jgi:hypothetical protein
MTSVYDIAGNTPQANPLYPLPPDYESLSAAGQREARLALVSDHLTPYRLTMAWLFFRRYYLWGIPEEYDHIRFYKSWVESPPFHSRMVYDMGRYALNAVVAPRGFSKSTIIALEIPTLLLLTRRGRFAINLGLSTERLMERTVGEIRRQLEENPLLRADFGVVKPRRTKGKWSDSALELVNGNSLFGLPIMGKKRGLRPNLFIFDDPEFDKDNQASQEALINMFDIILTKQVLPMLKTGCGVYWIGTLVSRKSFLYKIFSGEDARFEGWNRVLYAACRKVKDRYLDLLWPQGADEDFLRNMELLIGSANFASEFLGAPPSHTDRLLQVDKDLNTYTVEGVKSYDALQTMDPFDEESEVKVRFAMKRKSSVVVATADELQRLDEEPPIVWKTEKYDRWVSRLMRILFIDYALSVSRYSDYTSMLVCGMCKDDIVWPLDLQVGRWDPAVVNDRAMAMAEKWRVHMICPESVAVQYALAESLRNKVKMQEGEKFRHSCSVVLLDYGGRKISKADRIAGLQKFFNARRIKLPFGQLFMESWSWRQLYQQINDFTLDLSLLDHDDAIDTLAMFQYSPYGWGRTVAPEPTVLTPLDRLALGQLYFPDGQVPFPVASTIPLQEIPLEIIFKAREKFLQHSRDGGTMAIGGTARRRRLPNRFDAARPVLITTGFRS